MQVKSQESNKIEYSVGQFFLISISGLGSYIILDVHSLQAAVIILVKFLRFKNLGSIFVFDPT